MSQNGSTPPPYGGPQTGFAGRGTRFFDWMRSIGVTRADGWLGGVCAGIAYRIGIDPLIVRGIAVVAAILGAPVLLLYALAWALLPDREGRIHLQRLFDGAFEPPIVAIGVMLVLSLLPWTGGVWWLGGPFGHEPGWGDVVGRVLWTVVVVAAAAGLVVLAVRNAGRGDAAGGGGQGAGPGASSFGAGAAGAGASASAAGTSAWGAGAAGAGASGAGTTASGAGTTPSADPYGTARAATVASAAAVAAASTVPQHAADGPSAAEPATAGADAPAPDASTAPTATPLLDTAAEPTAPPAPGAGASPQDVADWRARQAQWRADHAQWKQRLDADMRAVKAQRSAEIKAQAAAATAAADARRTAYRAANPRVGAAIGWLAVGLALVAGALTAALWGPATGLHDYAFTAALAAATAVFGATVLVAGLSRRRSGFLIFLGMFLAVCTAFSALAPTTIRVGDAGVSLNGPVAVTPTGDAAYAQAWGSTTIDLSEAVTAPGYPIISFAKGAGETTILVPEDATVRVELDGPVPVTVTDPTGTTTQSCEADQRCPAAVIVGPPGRPDATVRIAQTDPITVERTAK